MMGRFATPTAPSARRDRRVRTERLRVLHVLPWIGGGGVERRRLELARRLPRDRFEMHVACFQHRVLRDEYAATGVRVRELGGSSPYRADVVGRLVQHVREVRPDIIHGAVFEGVQLAALAGRICGVPRIIVEETGDLVHRSWRGHLVMRACAAAAHAVVSVSHDVAERLAASGIERSHIRVIENGVSAPAAPDAARVRALRAEWGVGESDFVVVSAGRLRNDHKRFTDLIDAVALVAPKVPTIRCVIVGEGIDRAMIAEHAERAGVASRLVMPGFLPNVGDALALADVFALVSERESFGLALVEAMLFGLPVVATGAGGMRAILDEGRVGAMVEPYQPAQIADALARLHGDPDARRALARAGRAHAEQRFGVERYVADVVALYDSLLAR